MELKRYWFCASIVVFVLLVVLPKLLLCFGTPKRTGIFKVSKKHPKINSCAQEILQKDGYSGGRVNELTGECELLSGSLRNNNADTKGYAYLRMVSSERKYSPPLSQLYPVRIPDMIPGSTVVSLMAANEINQLMIEFHDNIPMNEQGFRDFNSSNWESGLTLYESIPGVVWQAVFYTPRLTQTCALTRLDTGKTISLSFTYVTNASLQVTIDDKSNCLINTTYNISGKLMAVTFEVYSIVEYYV